MDLDALVHALDKKLMSDVAHREMAAVASSLPRPGVVVTHGKQLNKTVSEMFGVKISSSHATTEVDPVKLLTVIMTQQRIDSDDEEIPINIMLAMDGRSIGNRQF